MLLFSLLLAAQADTVVLKDAPCAPCTIRVETVVQLGEKNGDAMVTSPRVPAVAVDPLGRYLVVTRPAMLAVFSPQGRLLRMVGRNGGGPGEYRRIWRVATSSSSIFVYDDIGRRRTQLSLDFNVVATQPMQLVPRSLAMRRDGSGVLAGIIPTRERIGFLLHDFDSRGNLTRSHHLSGISYREDLSEFFWRKLNPGVDAREYWSSHAREYAFERCRYEVNSCMLFLRPVEWFPRPSFEDWYEKMGTKPPPPFLSEVSEDSAGFVWTLSRVADARWASAISLGTGGEYGIRDFARYFDSLVELVDIRTGSVIASQRFDELFAGFVAPGTVWSYAEDDEGFGLIEIGRLMLDRTPITRRK